jgi:uncharacterized protein DUF6946
MASQSDNSIKLRGGDRSIESFEDWAAYGLPESRRALHWKDGRSALELGRAWTEPGYIRPPEAFQLLLDSNADLCGTRLLEGVVEHETGLPPLGSRGPRCHDLLLCGVRDSATVTISVEAKADEEFGKTLERELQQSLQRSENTKFPQRLDWLTWLLLGKSAFSDIGSRTLDPVCAGLYYQLFSAIAGTLLEAKHRKASCAVLIIHEFRTHSTSDVKQLQNKTALDTFLKLFFAANEWQGGTLPTARVIGPIRLANPIPDLGLAPPLDLPLYLGKLITDRLVVRS